MPALTEIENEFARLSPEAQLGLLERLVHRACVAVSGNRDPWEADPPAMAAGPEMQRELNRIKLIGICFSTLRGSQHQSPRQHRTLERAAEPRTRRRHLGERRQLADGGKGAAAHVDSDAGNEPRKIDENRSRLCSKSTPTMSAILVLLERS